MRSNHLRGSWKHARFQERSRAAVHSFVLLLALAATALTTVLPADAAHRNSWLIVSDIHLNPDKRNHEIEGHDPDPALLRSALSAMKRVNPRPPVIVIAGDFLAHSFDDKLAIPTMRSIARQLDRAFPASQFVLVLGNEDSACGDYGEPSGSAFLRAVAIAWEPLVDRGGAAPNFVRTFVRDGFYVASLPRAGLRAVVIDDVFWSPRYRAGCAGSSENPSATTFQELEASLPRGGRGNAWVFAHIPPGIDAYASSQIARNFLAVPLLQQRAKDRFLEVIGEPARHVKLVVAGHTHRFAFRLAGSQAAPVPILLAPAISPIFGNAPSFLNVDVDEVGTIRHIDEWSLLDGRWQNIGGSASLHMRDASGPSVLALQARLHSDAGIRSTFTRLYGGGAPSEINRKNWPVYWCVATEFTTSGFRACSSEGGIGIVTGKGIVAIVGASILVLAALAGIVVARRKQRYR